MPGFLPDSSCIIAAVSSWHGDHATAVAEIERRLGRRESMVLAAHALMEAYAVLTRMPSPYRLSGPDALTLLEVNFVRGRRLVALGPSSHLDVVRRAARDVVVGGRVYDALIGECAVSARVKTILTFNEDHFVSFRDRGLEVVVPSGRTRS